MHHAQIKTSWCFGPNVIISDCPLSAFTIAKRGLIKIYQLVTPTLIAQTEYSPRCKNKADQSKQLRNLLFNQQRRCPSSMHAVNRSLSNGSQFSCYIAG